MTSYSGTNLDKIQTFIGNGSTRTFTIRGTVQDLDWINVEVVSEDGSNLTRDYTYSTGRSGDSAILTFSRIPVSGVRIQVEINPDNIARNSQYNVTSDINTNNLNKESNLEYELIDSVRSQNKKNLRVGLDEPEIGDDTFVIPGYAERIDGGLGSVATWDGVGKPKATSYREFGALVQGHIGDPGLDTAQVDERIAPWARTNSPSGTVPDNRIPSTIARDSEVTSRVADEATNRSIADSSLGTRITNEVTARTAGDDLQSITVGSLSSLNAALTAQRASANPLEIVFSDDVTLSGTTYSRGTIVYVAPRSNAIESRFSIVTPAQLTEERQIRDGGDQLTPRDVETASEMRDQLQSHGTSNRSSIIHIIADFGSYKNGQRYYLARHHTDEAELVLISEPGGSGGISEARVDEIVNSAIENGVQIPARASPDNELNGVQQYFGADFYAPNAVQEQVLSAHRNGSTYWRTISSGSTAGQADVTIGGALTISGNNWNAYTITEDIESDRYYYFMMNINGTNRVMSTSRFRGDQLLGLTVQSSTSFSQNNAAQILGVASPRPDADGVRTFFIGRTSNSKQLYLRSGDNHEVVSMIKVGGVKGDQGAAGAAGAQGPQGPVGPQGPKGTDGADGAPGAKGDAGRNGSDGLRGPQGPAGADGAQGPVGPQGPKGDKGDTGPAGSGTELTTTQEIALLNLVASPAGITFNTQPNLAAQLRSLDIQISNPELLTGNVWIEGWAQGQRGLSRTKWATTTSVLRFSYNQAAADAIASGIFSDNQLEINLRFFDAASGGNEIERRDVFIPITSLVPGVQSLTSAASITWDVDKGEVADLTATQNFMLNLSNGVNGQMALLRVKQDATGSRTITLNSGIQLQGRTAPTLKTAASADDNLLFMRNATQWVFMGIL